MLGGCSPAANTETSTAGIGSATGLPTFDGARAFDLLKKQVEFGPRVPGTQPHSDCGAFLIETLRPLADEVTTQEFAATLGGKDLRLKNIIARFNPGAKRWVLLCAHWDTRPTADYEVVAEKRRLPIPGANDGASGTAVLLELARMFKQRKPDIGVVMVFFDGEDYGPGPNDMFLGSRHLASEALKGNLQPKRENIAYGILLDMIGDKDLRIPKEQYSLEAAPDVVRKIWDTAKALGHEKAFPDATGNAIMDDHVPLIKAGIKCVNLIDFEYGPWHTLEDSVDKCSARSLKTVGDVVGAVVYGEEGI
jgi:hypothetical protein